MTSEGYSLFDLAPGRMLAGRYNVVRAHRQGGLSASFEVTEGKSGERCEITVFPGALFEGAAQAEEYRRSWEPWKTIDSPHVLRVREAFSLQQQTLVLVTDFPEGPTLREWLKQHQRMEPEATLELGRQMLDGLVAIHALGLIHGDIKPQTVFATPAKGKGRLRGVLADGGITAGLWNAKHLGERTALIGTPFYAPVEQFGGDSPDVQSDVYNMATVLFELVTGVLPWAGTSLPEVFQAKLDKHPPSMKKRAPKVDVEPELEKAIAGGLMADRRDRYGSAAEFREALAAL